MAYVTKWRINWAGRLLTQTKQGVHEIATAVGFESVSALLFLATLETRVSFSRELSALASRSLYSRREITQP